ncbi:hypothetical protein, partial [Metabacillus sp. RGM 3146]|uniref:hypothetical protein n=1 Tax=Metabacillus sp. RGM 3146 TaxID=3401092 RepID=UPI003B993FC9
MKKKVLIHKYLEKACRAGFQTVDKLLDFEEDVGSFFCIMKEVTSEVIEMLSKNNQMNRDQMEMITLEQLVPEEHLV